MTGARITRNWFAVFRLLALTAVVFWSGCASHKIDWAARVGTYTYDDAVREMGPPDKSAKLSEGSTVADWMTGRGMRSASVYGGSWRPYGRYGGGGPGTVVVDQSSPDRFLRLTFDPQGKLASWKQVYK